LKRLAGKIILITKEKEENRDPAELLTAEGAEVIFFPAIKIVPLEYSSALDDALSRFKTFDYLIFTSANAASVFHGISIKYGLDLSDKIIAAAGSGTLQRCRSLGINVDIMPGRFGANGLLQCFSAQDIKNKKILIPSSLLANDELNEGLQAMGAETCKVPVYSTLPNDRESVHDQLKAVKARTPDLFAFTSPSSFRAYIEILEIVNAHDYFGSAVICAIGTTTESEIRSAGITVNIVPEYSSLDGIAESVIKYFGIISNIA
jgi:uroporphyrinogen-III synthase